LVIGGAIGNQSKLAAKPNIRQFVERVDRSIGPRGLCRGAFRIGSGTFRRFSTNPRFFRFLLTPFCALREGKLSAGQLNSQIFDLRVPAPDLALEIMHPIKTPQGFFLQIRNNLPGFSQLRIEVRRPLIALIEFGNHAVMFLFEARVFVGLPIEPFGFLAHLTFKQRDMPLTLAQNIAGFR
jgi:hypothetical protein